MGDLTYSRSGEEKEKVSCQGGDGEGEHRIIKKGA